MASHLTTPFAEGSNPFSVWYPPDAASTQMTMPGKTSCLPTRRHVFASESLHQARAALPASSAFAPPMGAGQSSSRVGAGASSGGASSSAGTGRQNSRTSVSSASRT
jgi:hypothetical protein